MKRTSRLNRHEIDKLLGQTPCLCGETETWHPVCYVGKSDDEIKNQYRIVYKDIRHRLKENAKRSAGILIKLVSMK